MAEQRVPSTSSSKAAPETGLQRSLTLPSVTLYGLGVTIGAGIYVLIEATAGLAVMTSRITLVIFTLVNLALFQIKRSGEPAPANAFVVYRWVPILGIVSCIVLLLGEHS